ncbi:MAG: hypothetical protein GXP40_10615 [Chloroflexi bacterium]|nr:hypothetical protein [Chloroflexota bacterium]
MLHSVGISLTVHLLGVAEAEQKRRALETVGAAVVVPSLAAALSLRNGWDALN